ncbi:hypothetical protein MJM83_34990, partial [Salmonella enterica subsp. enterica serovar Montevideo]|nr:hypothetical protein [Salmonella enterica subsp. enterica serovar Montevideo]
GITANKEVCEGYVYNSIGIVTYLNPFIGHHNGDIVGKICAETVKNLSARPGLLFIALIIVLALFWLVS